MSSDKSVEVAAPRTTTQGSLLSQWWTLGDIILDRRTNGSGRHIKVAWVIIDRHMQAKGNSRASVRFIEQATGLSKGIIIKACRELVEWGYMTQRIGIGTRPTEFSPNWSSVSPASNTKDILSSVPLESNTSVPPESNTTDFSVPPESNESCLPVPAYKAGLQVGGNIDTLDAMPPAGLAPAEAGTRGPEERKDPFDQFWQSFPRKFQKLKARAAWNKINPDVSLGFRIVEKANLWSEHYSRQGTDKKWIPAPANWLAGERWDEDLPDVYVDAKEAAIAKAKDRGSNPARGAKPVAANGNKPIAPWPANDNKQVEISTVRRDITITKIGAISAVEPGVRVHVDFNDCELGDEPSAVIDITNTKGLYEAAGRSGRHAVGARVFLDVDDYPDDFQNYRFAAHPENEQQAA